MKRAEIFSIISYVLSALFIIAFLFAFISLIGASILALALFVILYLFIFIGFFVLCVTFAIVAVLESRNDCNSRFKKINIIQAIVYSIIIKVSLCFFLLPPLINALFAIFY